MQQYFNRVDREHHIIMMVYNVVINDWLEMNKSLTKDERRFIKTGLTWIKKATDAMIVRSNPEYIKTLKNHARHSDLYLEDTTGKKLSCKTETRTIAIDDLYDLADFALRGCHNCKEKDFKNCERFKVYMKLAIPPMEEVTDDCPYRA